MRGRVAAACRAHYPKVGGSNPPPATVFHFMLYIFLRPGHCYDWGGFFVLITFFFVLITFKLPSTLYSSCPKA